MLGAISSIGDSSCIGKCFELGFLPRDSSEEIFAHLMAEIRSLEKVPPFKGRHIDTETLENLGPYVDWYKTVFHSLETV
jgi:hypothetical protein